MENILEGFIVKNIMNLDDFETRRKMVNEVSKEDIVEVAKKMTIDTIYLLKGEDDGKD